MQFDRLICRSCCERCRFVVLSLGPIITIKLYLWFQNGSKPPLHGEVCLEQIARLTNQYRYALPARDTMSWMFNRFTKIPRYRVTCTVTVTFNAFPVPVSSLPTFEFSRYRCHYRSFRDSILFLFMSPKQKLRSQVPERW